MPPKDMEDLKIYINENEKLYGLERIDSLETLPEIDCEVPKDFANINLNKEHSFEFISEENKALFQALFQMLLPNNRLKMLHIPMRRQWCKKND